MASAEVRQSFTDRREADCISTELGSWFQLSELRRPVRFSRDWRIVIVGGGDGGVRVVLWPVISEREAGERKGHDEPTV